MPDIDAELSKFVEVERALFDGEDNNKFAMAFGQILRYCNFLGIITRRHEDHNREFFKLIERQKQLFSPGSGQLTKEQATWWEGNTRLCTHIQLEIESYYLFAKILLDKVSRFVEFFFGPERGLSLDSHDQMTKCFDAYAKNKNLKDYDRVKTCLASLKADIADFRDYQISHEKSPRTIRGVSFSGAGQTSIFSTKLYPKVTEVQVQSETPGKLEEDLHVYLREIISLIQTNRDASKLKRRIA